MYSWYKPEYLDVCSTYFICINLFGLLLVFCPPTLSLPPINFDYNIEQFYNKINNIKLFPGVTMSSMYNIDIRGEGSQMSDL